MDGWVFGWFPIGKNALSWLHLSNWNSLDSQLSWEYKIEPSINIQEQIPYIKRNLTNVITRFSSNLNIIN